MTNTDMERFNRAGSETVDVADGDDLRIERCIAQVRHWLEESARCEAKLPRSTRRRAKRIGTVVKDAATAEVMMALTDEVLRVKDTRAAAVRFRDAIRSTRTALPLTDRTMLALGAFFAPRLHRLVMPLVVGRLRRETASTIIAAEPAGLNSHQRQRRALGFSLNVNRLGEAILGHGEATLRREGVIEMINRSSTTNVSIKLSAIAANISALDYEPTIQRLLAELRPVYSAALQRGVFVNLDMEEYRDLAITVDVFKHLLDEDGFTGLTAGIVLQAYLPDSHAAAADLGLWAKRRVEDGGAPIRIRLVKGANLSMEVVDAELHGWNLATYNSKLDVDASWKRLLDAMLSAKFDSALIVGAASHNLFDIAWALQKREELSRRGCPDRLQFEMLEGMAEAQARSVLTDTGQLLMYTPVVDKADFVPAIGYLTRRLDENTGPENFLRALVDLTVDSTSFSDQKDRFVAAVHRRHAVSTESFRRPSDRVVPAGRDFSNCADSDVTQSDERTALLEAVGSYVPCVPPELVTEPNGVDAVLASATEGRATWAATTHVERARLARSVADRIAQHRPEIVALLAHEANKVLLEGDSEVSEAIDFANYYAHLAEGLETTGESYPLGVVLVTPPWNFAYAITMGGVLAGLCAGNVVVLKPTPQCPRVAQRVAEDCWSAGIPKSALHLLAVPDDEVGRHLITHDRVDAVILTGSLQTAKMFLSWKPRLRLLAETSGKNSLVIMASADLDLAIKDLVKSAFGHAGQKCSAASIAIVEASVYDNPDFRRRLADAVTSLKCGPATDPGTDVPPLIEAPSESLLRAFTTLETGESWLVQPVQYDAADPRCWTPGVRLGVTPGSWLHMTECFGPVLGIVRANDLAHALEVQNQTPYGLTAGIHTLDRHEVTEWVSRVEAGNIYVNRTITGAIVCRQPFGGWKQSSIGPTAKAGGPSYVNILRRWPLAPERTTTTTWFDLLGALAVSEVDPSALQSETNVLRHRPLPNGVAVYLGRGSAAVDRDRAVAAGRACGVEVSIFGESSDGSSARSYVDLLNHLRSARPDRLRIIGESPDELWTVAHELGIRVDNDGISDEPHVEVVRWMREQSVSVTQHRHGRPHRLPYR